MVITLRGAKKKANIQPTRPLALLVDTAGCKLSPYEAGLGISISSASSAPRQQQSLILQRDGGLGNTEYCEAQF